MSIFERAAEANFVMNMMHDDEQRTNLGTSGLDPDGLEYMDEDERREALEDAGLDPDDYE